MESVVGSHHGHAPAPSVSRSPIGSNHAINDLKSYIDTQLETRLQAMEMRLMSVLTAQPGGSFSNAHPRSPSPGSPGSFGCFDHVTAPRRPGSPGGLPFEGGGGGGGVGATGAEGLVGTVEASSGEHQRAIMMREKFMMKHNSAEIFGSVEEEKARMSSRRVGQPLGRSQVARAAVPSRRWSSCRTASSARGGTCCRAS